MEDELIDIVKVLEEKVEKCNWSGELVGIFYAHRRIYNNCFGT